MPEKTTEIPEAAIYAVAESRYLREECTAGDWADVGGERRERKLEAARLDLQEALPILTAPLREELEEAKRNNTKLAAAAAPTPEQPEDGKVMADELERGARELGIKDEAPRNRADELRAAAAESDDPAVTRRYLDALHAAQPEQPEEPTCGGSGKAVLEPMHAGCPTAVADCPGCPDCTEQEAEGEEAAAQELKCWPPYFEWVLTGRKSFECREIADRTFAEGEILRLREYDGSLHDRQPETGGYTGRSCLRRITCVLGDGDWGIRDGNVVLGLEPAERDSRLTKEAVREKLLARNVQTAVEKFAEDRYGVVLDHVGGLIGAALAAAFGDDR